MMLKFTTLPALAAGILLATGASAQSLPNGFNDDELQLMQRHGFAQPQTRGITAAPGGQLRTMAEWEEIQTLVVTYTGFPSIVRQIIDYAQEECQVLVTCDDSVAVKNDLLANGIPLTNVKYLQVPYNSIWIRDYGAHSVYRNDVDSLFMVDWIYNRPRPADDVMPEAQMLLKNIPLYSTTAAPTDLVNTGGNWMVDGFGTAFASKLILEENEPGNPYGVTPKTEAQVDTIMKNFMGINRYIKMETLPYDAIHHIDMHMKLLDEETLLMGQYPTGVSDGPQIEANLQYVLDNFNSTYGTPYKIIRIPMPPSTGGGHPSSGASYRTYSNNVFVNKTVLVPGYRTEYDTVAMRILSAALPGYNIKFIDCDNGGSNIIAQSGAIHCITNVIGVADPLLISHQALHDTYDDVNPYAVNAFIRHRSGINTATLYYSTNGGSTYATVAMTPTGGNYFTANIPAQAVGTVIKYYIHAQAVSGKQQVRPMVAPAGDFTFKVLGVSGVAGQSQNPLALNVFPNPASAITCIELQNTGQGKTTVTLQNVLAQQAEVLYSGTPDGQSKKVFFDASAYAAGTYLVKVSNGSGTYVTRLVIR